MRIQMKSLKTLGCLAGGLLLAGAAWAAKPLILGLQPDGSVLVPSSQTLTPVGAVVKIDRNRPKDLAVSPDGQTVAVLCTYQIDFYNPSGVKINDVPSNNGLAGITWSPDGKAAYASQQNNQIARLTLTGGEWRIANEIALTPPPGTPDAVKKRFRGDIQVSGLAISPDGQTLYAASAVMNAVLMVELGANKLTRIVPVQMVPFHVALSHDGGTLFVSNAGGRAPKPGESTESTHGDMVRVDPRTSAPVEGSISFVNTKTFTVSSIPAGREPEGIALSKDGSRLYVASANDDTLVTVDAKNRRVLSVLNLRPAEDAGFGQIPTNVALSTDDKTAYVCLGGGNSIAVIALSDSPLRTRIMGYLPTAWYPMAAAANRGKIIVACAKGIGSRALNKDNVFWSNGVVGAMQFIPSKALKSLGHFTRMVAKDNHWNLKELPARKNIAAVPVPARVGEPSVFKHVVYIIKENHSYDIDLGDMKEGNGDAKLCIFGENVTPNEHKIARDFVLLDNTYTSGTTSADGHQWTDSAVANAYMEANYRDYIRSYGVDPLSDSPQGFTWTSVAAIHKSVKVYGEYVHSTVEDKDGHKPNWFQFWKDYKAGTHIYKVSEKGALSTVAPYVVPDFVGFYLPVTDQWRADRYLEDLKGYEKNNNMPAFTQIELPDNHTAGVNPNYPTPRAEVADNDLALGRIVDGISHSKFWKNTLILVIEDDSQNGLDHVDGHRTVAFCVSPYTKRHAVIHNLYTHVSLVRTLGLVLGFPPMTRFDRTATPMGACFNSTPDLTPYDHVANQVLLDEKNPAKSVMRPELKRLMAASQKQNLTIPDVADTKVITQAMWASARPGQPFPWNEFHYNKGDGD